MHALDPGGLPLTDSQGNPTRFDKTNTYITRLHYFNDAVPIVFKNAPGACKKWVPYYYINVAFFLISYQ